MGKVKTIDLPGPSWRTRLLCTQKGDPKACAFNTRLILENDPAWREVLSWCEFSQRIVKRRLAPLANAALGEWDDGDDADLRFWLADNYGIEPGHKDIADALLGVARGAPFHPIRDYLDGLVWDGIERLPTWVIEYLRAGQGGESPTLSDRQLAARDRYYTLVGEMWLVQSIARVRKPGCKADNVLILEGAQGLRKSTALKVLYGDEWFSDTPLDLASKDAMEMIRGLWCCEMAELDALNKTDARRAKAFFSSATDRFRLPYGQRTARFPRQVVMAGTTNQQEYLKDWTGNRRFMPIDCGEVDIQGLQEVRDQLWAEADHRFKDGAVWWPETEEEKGLFEEEQADRVDADVWEPVIQAWLRERLFAAPPERRSTLFVTAADVMTNALGMDTHAMKRPEQTRVGMILHTLGWRNVRLEINRERVRGYKPGIRLLDSLGKADDLPPF